MTPWEQEQKRLRKIAARAKAQEIWAQVYAAIYSKHCETSCSDYAAGRAIKAANDAVQRFEDHLKP